MPRRILFFTPFDLSLDNGPGINEREFVRMLLDEFPAEVLCAAPRAAFPARYFDRRIEYVPPAPRRNPFAFLRGTWAQYHQLLRVCKKRNVEVVAGRMGFLPVTPLLLAKSLGVPLALKTVAGYGLVDPGSPRRRRILGRVVYPARRSMLRAAALLDTPCSTYADWIATHYELDSRRLTVVPNGANIDVFCPGNQEEARRKLGLADCKFIVGYVGALAGWRNTAAIIEGFHGLSARHPVTLVVVGDGPARAGMEEAVRARGISDRVRFCGQVAYRSVPDYLRAFDLAIDLTRVSMQIGDQSRATAFSQKVAQYLACGTPTVAWRVDDTQWIEEEDVGGLISVSAELAEVGSRLLSDDPGSRERRRVRARVYAERELCIRALARRRIEMWQQLPDWVT